MAEYFYDKYALIVDYEEISQTEATSTASSTVYADNIIEDDVYHDGITMDLDLDSYYWYNFKSEYEVVVNRSYGDIKDYKFVVSGDTAADTVPFATYVYRKISDHKIEKYRPILRTIWFLSLIHI